MTKTTDDVQAHYGDIVQSYTDYYDPEKIWTTKIYPAAYFRLQNLLNVLRGQTPGRVLDAGCGEGSPLIAISELGYDVRGFDFTDNMVGAAKQHFSEKNLNPDWIIKASVDEFDTFSSLVDEAPFDLAICWGVMPHVNSDLQSLKNLRRALKPGGKAHISFRNELFNIFTFNRFTYSYIMEGLLGDAPAEIREKADEFLEGRLEKNVPPPRLTTDGGKPGYDAIKAGMHHPMDMPALFGEAGFRFDRFFWYHYHPIFPMLEGKAVDKETFRKAAFELEKNPFDSRGAVMCSAFVVEATAE